MTIPYRDVGVGLVKDSGLLGTFPFPPINASSSTATIHMISTGTIVNNDPWIIPYETKLDSFGTLMPLSPYEFSYQAVQSFFDPTSTQIDLMNEVHEE